MKKIVIALGGNALGNSPSEQLKAVEKASKSIVNIIEKNGSVAIVHGNGPQVGVINLAMNEALKIGIGVPEFPLVECVSMSQGYIGCHLQQAIQNEIKNRNLDKNVATLVTQVEVDKNDSAFLNPTKPIGNFYKEEDAKKIAKEKGYVFKEDAGRGYRRVVASPEPKKIVELDVIQKMLLNDITVITCGGGGVPVIKNNEKLSGVDAVIDKDLAAAKLSEGLDADSLIILTAVDNVYINFNKTNQKVLDTITVDEAKKYIKEGQFAKGSMLPKVEACIKFVGNNKNREAIIASLDNADKALNGEFGTRIISNNL